jgi:hypothetical protein
VSLTNTEVATSGEGLATSAGQILFQADNIALNQSTLDAFAGDNAGGPITLVSRGGLDIRNSTLVTAAGFTSGGPVDLQAETSINLTSTIIDARGFFGDAGSITMAAPNISISNSGLDVSNLTGTAGIISLMGTKAVRLSDGTVLSAVGSGDGTGGTIQVKAPTIKLTDSQLTTSVSSIGSGGGSITVEANNLTLKNSQILSTATEGQGGTIDITSPIFHQDASSVIDASSQSGTDGTVTINGVIQP